MKNFSLMLLSSIYLIGCVSVQEYQPVVDPRSISDQGQFTLDKYECENVVDQIDYTSAENQAALLGGIAGASTIVAGTSALVGLTGGVVFWPIALPLAAAAALFGGSRTSNTVEEKEQKMRAIVWNSCLVERGYTVLSTEGVPLQSTSQNISLINQQKQQTQSQSNVIESEQKDTEPVSTVKQTDKVIYDEQDVKRQALEEELIAEAQRRRKALEEELIVEEEAQRQAAEEAQRQAAEEAQRQVAEEAQRQAEKTTADDNDLKIMALEAEIKQLKIKALEEELQKMKSTQKQGLNEAEKVEKSSEVVYVLPKISRPVAPVYSEYSQESGHEGEVVILFNVSVGGKAINIDFKKSSGYIELDQAALDAIEKTVFIPATLDGIVVESERLQRTFSFKLQEN